MMPPSIPAEEKGMSSTSELSLQNSSTSSDKVLESFDNIILDKVARNYESYSVTKLKSSDSERREQLQELVEKVSRRAYWIAFDLFGSREEAEDAVQEAYLKALQNWDKFDSRSTRETWFFRILINLSLNKLRRKNIWNKVSELFSKKNLTQENFQLPEKSLEKSELYSNISAAVKELSPKQRLIFTLRYIQEFSLKEIAEMMEMSEGTVKSHLFRALKNIRKSLKNS